MLCHTYSLAQINNTMEEKNNPLLCDPMDGLCVLPDQTSFQNEPKINAEKLIKVIYFTDPICSSCWGIEPQLRMLKLEYGTQLEIEYRMGGLLPDWSYNSGGISKPSDVAHHWDEVSIHYDMPIDGDVWLEDPLHSSYPPSIAFKAAQLQDKAKALLFLREMREMVFLKKKNIAKWEIFLEAANNVGLDTLQLKADFANKGKLLFEEDLKLARELGVRGFPTLFFINSTGHKEIVYGSRPYAAYEQALLKMSPQAVKQEYGKSWEELFKKYHSLTAREYAELSAKQRTISEQELNELSDKGVLAKLITKNGSLWTLKK